VGMSGNLVVALLSKWDELDLVEAKERVEPRHACPALRHALDVLAHQAHAVENRPVRRLDFPAPPPEKLTSSRLSPLLPTPCPLPLNSLSHLSNKSNSEQESKRMIAVERRRGGRAGEDLSMMTVPTALGSAGLKAIQKSPVGPEYHSSGESFLSTNAIASGASASLTVSFSVSVKGVWQALSSILMVPSGLTCSGGANQPLPIREDLGQNAPHVPIHSYRAFLHGLQ
jgi:hypothetical protein